MIQCGLTRCTYTAIILGGMAEFGSQKRALLRDTYLMQPGEKAELVFIANNPGAWLFHCHMLEHHAAGMGGVIYIS